MQDYEKTEVLDWKTFKSIVKELRIKQKRLMKKQGGTNRLLVSISLLNIAIQERGIFYPNGINLRTGIGQALINGVYTDVSVRSWIEAYQE